MLSVERFPMPRCLCAILDTQTASGNFMTHDNALNHALSAITGVARLMTMGESSKIRDYLEEGEVPAHATSGMRKLGYGLLLATDRRVIWLDTSLLTTRVESLTYTNITHVEMTRGMVYGNIILHAVYSPLYVTLVPRDTLMPFFQHVARMSEAARKPRDPGIQQ